MNHRRLPLLSRFGRLQKTIFALKIEIKNRELVWNGATINGYNCNYRKNAVWTIIWNSVQSAAMSGKKNYNYVFIES